MIAWGHGFPVVTTVNNETLDNPPESERRSDDDCGKKGVVKGENLPMILRKGEDSLKVADTVKVVGTAGAKASTGLYIQQSLNMNNTKKPATTTQVKTIVTQIKKQ